MACGHCGATHPVGDQTCARTGRPLDEPGPCGKTIDRYEIESLLQLGGFGAVYRGRHVHTRRAVAVKILDAELAADTAMLVRFKREAQAIAAIESPHVVQIFDWGVLPTGAAYLAMELLAGQDLHRELAEHGALPLERALAIERQILVGLQAAHASGIVHRDLKPANVFLAGETVKLIDFGISKLVGAAKPDGFRTSTGTSFGTPGYMPPEQIRGAQIDERCDLYAAGVVLYEMLSGTTPHPSTSYEDYVVRACTEPARPIRELVPDLPDHVDRAIMRALEPDPARRWTSTVAFARMLAGEAPTDAPTRRERSAEAATVMEIARPAEAATVVDAAQPPTVVDAPRPRRSARWPIIVAAAVVATAGAVAWRVSLADDARSVAAAPVVAETHDAAATGTHDAAEAGDAAIAVAAPAPPRPEHRSPAPTARLDAKLAARACSGTLGWQACPLLVCGCAEGKEKASVCDGGVGGKDRCAPSAVTCGRACAKLGGWTGQVTDGASVGLARSDRDCLESDVCVQEKRCRLRGDECVKTGCRDTHACQRDGACKDPDEHDDAGLALRDNTCVVGSDADCAASTGCKTEGRCRLELVRHAITGGNLARCTK